MISLIKWMTDDSLPILWFRKWFKYDYFEGIDKIITCFIYFCAESALLVNQDSIDLFIKYDLVKSMKMMSWNDTTIIDHIDYSNEGAVLQSAQLLGEQLRAQILYYIDQPRGQSLKSDVIIALNETKQKRITQLFQTTFTTMISSYSEELVEKQKNNLKKIETVFSDKCLEDLDIVTGKVKSLEEQREFLMKSGLNAIDLSSGGWLTRTVYALVAQVNTGKTRFACKQVVYNALLHKHNVYFNSLEMNEADIKNMLTAIHVMQKYRVIIPDTDMMIQGKLTDEEMKLFAAAKFDLFESGNYGKLFIERDTTLSTLKEDVERMCDLNNVKVYVLDYAGFLSAGNDIKYARFSNYEIIEEAYKILINLSKKKNFMGFILNQFNKEGANAALSGKKESYGEIQGGTAVDKYSEYTIYMTKARDQGDTLRTMSCVKSRVGPKFNPVVLRCNLAISNFTEIVGG